MLNPALDTAALARDFSLRRRLQVRDVLLPEAAEAIHACLARDVPWSLSCRYGGEDRLLAPEQLASLPPGELGGIGRRVLESAGAGFAFAFMSYAMVDNYRRGANPGLLLNSVVEEIASPAFVEFARALTGDGRIRRVDMQATRYEAGHFLNVHDDGGEEGADRLYAYVLNFSRGWRAEWGGLLQFLDDRGGVEESLVPHFNSLSIFAVPRLHIVSQVASFAAAPRLAVTGWFRP